MPAYYYEAINKQGAKKTGVIEADSEKNARQQLRKSHLIPLLTTPHQNKNTSKKARKLNSLSHKELVLVTRQLATLLAAGLALDDVLTAVAEQTDNQRTQGLILSVRSKVMEGHSFAEALNDFPNAFSTLYCSTVAAGEKTGHLDLILQRLADYTERQYATRLKIKNALIYPSLMLIIAIGIVIFLLEYIVPKMVSVYTDAKQTLPLMTLILINISAMIQQWGIYFLGACVGLVVVVRTLISKNKRFKFKFDKLLLKIPLLGKTIKNINTARLARTFAILSSAGVPVLEAMRTSYLLISNLPIQMALQQATQQVKEGMSIHLALKKTQYFPPMSLHLIASGEASGQLETMLERASDNQENETARFIDTLLALFEPAIILVMGSIVLFIVLAVLLPIFELNQMLG